MTSLSPGGGPTAAGTAVTLVGTGFTGATGVKFGTVAATNVSVVSDTQITATAPAGSAGTPNVTVTTPGGTSVAANGNKYAYTALPTVTSLTKSCTSYATAIACGPEAGGSSVVINGTNLTGGNARVYFGQTAATSFVVNSATKITAVAPAGAGLVDVTVSTYGGTTAAGIGFTYIVAPVVQNISPAVGTAAGGDTITVSGTDLIGATRVAFGATTLTCSRALTAVCFDNEDDTLTVSITPAGVGGKTVDIRVTTPGGLSDIVPEDQFSYLLPPVVTGISPNSGPIFTSVTISGTNLSTPDGVTVAFGGYSAASVVDNGDGTITAMAPQGADTLPQPVHIVVTNSIGQSSTEVVADLFTYVLAPAVTSLTPSSGAESGGELVTISGDYLTEATAVYFDGTQTEFGVFGDGSIWAYSPSHPAGAVDVTVENAAGLSVTTASDVFTYGSPVIWSLSPTRGSVLGGAYVTISGDFLGGGAMAVSFGGILAQVWDNGDGTLTAISPEHVAGEVIVTVDSGYETSSATFTYMDAATVTGISPASGPGFTQVTITGTNLLGAAGVDFGGVAADFIDNGDGTITATAPPVAAGTGVVDVIVHGAGGDSIAVADDEFTYIDAPEITGLYDGVASVDFPLGQPVTAGPLASAVLAIGGENLPNLGAATGDLPTGTCLVNGINARCRWSGSGNYLYPMLTVWVPAGAAGTTVAITLKNSSGTSAPSPYGKYTFVAAPVVTGVSLNPGEDGGTSINGSVGTYVFITVVVADIGDVTGVKFGGVVAYDFASYFDDVTQTYQLLVPVPDGSGTVDITVQTAGGTSGPGFRFTYL
ncbi:unannotated protein [freshwater metagenome]|uniref:Unannotated protein n=1 Tax=freshwater metagenome TaxID=449393 RepID=A0A6J7DYT8_9ZZZZ